jgi:hypothetical protein
MVVLTRSVEFLPIALIIALFINSTIWTCYGINSKDIFLLVGSSICQTFDGVTSVLYPLHLYFYLISWWTF